MTSCCSLDSSATSGTVQIEWDVAKGAGGSGHHNLVTKAEILYLEFWAAPGLRETLQKGRSPTFPEGLPGSRGRPELSVIPFGASAAGPRFTEKLQISIAPTEDSTLKSVYSRPEQRVRSCACTWGKQ